MDLNFFFYTTALNVSTYLKQIKLPVAVHTCPTCSVTPSIISTMAIKLTFWEW